MKIGTDELIHRTGACQEDVSIWMAEGWILPSRGDDRIFFNEADVARVRLILELRRDFIVNDAAIPMILALIDQLHAMRHRMSDLGAALDELPEPMRAEISNRIRERIAKRSR